MTTVRRHHHPVTHRPHHAAPHQAAHAAAPAPAADSWKPALGTGARLQGLGLHKDGMTIPNGGQGKGTVFWNGHYSYKGHTDRENMSKGAWGDANKPTDYAIALPVGLHGGGGQWHNQKILITNPATGRQVVALVQDKGPHPRTGAKIDMTPVVMEGLGVNFQKGSAQVKFEFAPPDAKVGPV